MFFTIHSSVTPREDTCYPASNTLLRSNQKSRSNDIKQPFKQSLFETESSSVTWTEKGLPFLLFCYKSWAEEFREGGSGLRCVCVVHESMYLTVMKHPKSTFHKDTMKTYANKKNLFFTLKGHSRPGCWSSGTNRNLPKMMRQHETDDGQMKFVEHHMID